MSIMQSDHVNKLVKYCDSCVGEVFRGQRVPVSEFVVFVRPWWAVDQCVFGRGLVATVALLSRGERVFVVVGDSATETEDTCGLVAGHQGEDMVLSGVDVRDEFRSSFSPFLDSCFPLLHS